ncbi:Phosphoglucomutase, partial [Phytophthora palmivora]
MSLRTDEEWLAEAQQWADWDVNAGTKTQVQQLVATKDVVRIRELFGSRVAFGTAGL